MNGNSTKVKDPNQLNYLSTAGERIVWFIPFPRILALYEMQTAKFTCSDDNGYAMSASFMSYIKRYFSNNFSPCCDVNIVI